MSPGVRLAQFPVPNGHTTVPMQCSELGSQLGLTNWQTTRVLHDFPLSQLEPASLFASRLDTHEELGQMPVDRQQWWKQLPDWSQVSLGLVPSTGHVTAGPPVGGRILGGGQVVVVVVGGGAGVATTAAALNSWAEAVGVWTAAMESSSRPHHKEGARRAMILAGRPAGRACCLRTRPAGRQAGGQGMQAQGVGDG